MFSCKSQPAFLAAHFIICRQYSDIISLDSAYSLYILDVLYVCVSVRCSLLDDTDCRGPVYCIAYSISTRSISPVGIQYTGISFQHYSQYILVIGGNEARPQYLQ